MKFKYLASVALLLLLASCAPSTSNNRPTSSSRTPSAVNKTEAAKLNIFGSNLALVYMGKKVTPFSPSLPMPEMRMMSSRMQ
jgi:hypothetical protein